MVWPKTLAMTAVSNWRISGSFSVTNARTPTFCKPMAFTMPLAVSQIRGAGAPSIGCAESPFTTIPPRQFKSTSCANSMPYPNVPLAAMTGFVMETLPTWTPRSTAAGREGLLDGADELTYEAYHTGRTSRSDKPIRQWSVPDYATHPAATGIQRIRRRRRCPASDSHFLDHQSHVANRH